jgi:hypothetical protein
MPKSNKTKNSSPNTTNKKSNTNDLPTSIPVTTVINAPIFDCPNPTFSSSAMDAKKLELLNDHYKDTFADIEEYQKRRERWFYAVVIAIMLLTFQTLSANESATILSKLLAKYVGVIELNNKTFNLDPKFISSLVWFLLFTFLSKYYQTQFQIESLYHYIAHLETALNKEYQEFGKKLFTRESQSYQTNPVTQRIYHHVFPIIFFIVPLINILFSGWKLISNYSHSFAIYFVINLVFFGLIIALYWQTRKEIKQRKSN